MKKLLIGVLSLAFVSCVSAAISLQNINTSAQEEQNTTSVFTETKCQISKDGDKMLMVTGITDVSKIYEMGYDISGGYELRDDDIKETTKYYQSLTLGGTTKIASEFSEGAEGLLIWEIAYNSAITYTVQPYAYIGTLNASGQLISSSNDQKSCGEEKPNLNVVTVTFVDEDGSTLGTQSVNIGTTVSKITAPEKENYTFKGWYVGDKEYNFDTKVTSNLTLTAKYNAHVKYSVEVLAAQYEGKSGEGVLSETLTYVDKTSEYASVFGLDKNGQAKGEVGSTVDLTEKIKTLKGAKLNAESVTSGVIVEDEEHPLTLTVKLDFDAQELGFDVEKVTLGYMDNKPIFSLKYMNGECGLSFEASSLGNGRYIYINFDEEIKSTDYTTIIFNYYEKSKITNTKLGVNAGTADLVIANASEPSDYVKASVDLLEKFSTETSFSKITLLTLNSGTTSDKSIFIPAIEKVEKKPYVKENVTYSVANGNIMGIAKALGSGTVGTETHYFANNNEGIALSADALAYKNPNGVSGEHSAAVVFDLGMIKVSDYASIKVVFDTDSNNKGSRVYINGTDVTPISGLYGGAHEVDLITLAKDKGISEFATFEIAHANWAGITYCNIYVASIALVLA